MCTLSLPGKVGLLVQLFSDSISTATTADTTNAAAATAITTNIAADNTATSSAITTYTAATITANSDFSE